MKKKKKKTTVALKKCASGSSWDFNERMTMAYFFSHSLTYKRIYCRIFLHSESLLTQKIYKKLMKSTKRDKKVFGYFCNTCDNEWF